MREVTLDFVRWQWLCLKGGIFPHGVIDCGAILLWVLAWENFLIA
jgi:hypothetical protein